MSVRSIIQANFSERVSFGRKNFTRQNVRNDTPNGLRVISRLVVSRQLAATRGVTNCLVVCLASPYFPPSKTREKLERITRDSMSIDIYFAVSSAGESPVFVTSELPLEFRGLFLLSVFSSPLFSSFPFSRELQHFLRQRCPLRPKTKQSLTLTKIMMTGPLCVFWHRHRLI